MMLSGTSSSCLSKAEMCYLDLNHASNYASCDGLWPTYSRTPRKTTVLLGYMGVPGPDGFFWLLCRVLALAVEHPPKILLPQQWFGRLQRFHYSRAPARPHAAGR